MLFIEATSLSCFSKFVSGKPHYMHLGSTALQLVRGFLSNCYTES